MVSRSRFPRSASLFLCVLTLIALDGSTRADDLEEKLLRAELLEVSAGDLPKAMEAYKAIQADEKAPAELRARAQLNLGRCQRKLGELEGAKRTLEELIAAHPGEREIVRQAQGFLKELQGGKPENPQFDWLKELEKSPEIQARVFDLCMDLASNDRSPSARRQLRALGTVAVPGMERVLQVSRDDPQKEALAVTLVQCGRYEWLQTLLDPENPPDWTATPPSFLMEQFVMEIPRLPEATRHGIIEAADRITDPRLALHVSLVRLLAGDRRELGAQLKAIEPFILGLGDQRLQGLGMPLLERLTKEAPAAEFMAARILEDECPSDVRYWYITALRASAPAKLTAEHYARTVEKGRSVWLGELAMEENFAALERVAPIVGAQGIVEAQKELLRGSDGGWKSVPAGWARVLRAAHAYPELHWLAYVNDGALPEFASFLRNRAVDAPDSVPATFAILPPGFSPGELSAAHAAAMTLLLDSSDPVALAIALESLARATEKLSPETLDVIERLAREASDDHVREFALNALLGNFSRDPETGPRAAAALFQEFTRRRAAKEAPASFAASPLASMAGIGHTVRWTSKAPPRRISRPGTRPPAAAPQPLEPASFADSLDWICRRLVSMGKAGQFAEAFYPHVLQLADMAGGERYYSWYVEVSGVNELEQHAFLESLAKVQSPELMVRFVDMLLQRFPAKQQGPTPAFPPEMAGKLVAFFQRVALDDRVPIVSRLTACALGMEDAYAALDWPRLLEAGDPLAEGILTGLMPVDKDRGRQAVPYETFWRWFAGQSAEFQRKFFAAGIASTDESIRAKVVSQHPLEGPEIPAIFRKLLQDPSYSVRWEATARLGSGSRADFGPLFVEMLSHPDSQLRNEAVKQLPRFASVESIEPLSKLLEDPDVKVRGAALEALKKIKAALEERKEWQDMVERLKSIPRPDKKSE